MVRRCNGDGRDKGAVAEEGITGRKFQSEEPTFRSMLRFNVAAGKIPRSALGACLTSRSVF